MYQIDQATAASSLPTPAPASTQGYFTNGNPASNIPATIVDADFLNMLMLELANIVGAAGITPSKTTYNQVLSAIRALKGMGCLLGANVYTTAGSASFAPQTANSAILTFAQGGGGAAGSCVATAASQFAESQGGASGGLSIGLYQLSSATPIPLTIGAGGVPAAGTVGGAGGTTSVGTLFNVYGGAGGAVSGAQSNTASWVSGVSQTVATAGTANILNSQGVPAPPVITAQGLTYAGPGAPGWLGGGPATQSSIQGIAGVPGILGGGGRGCANGASASALAGGAGGVGWILLFEFGSK